MSGTSTGPDALPCKEPDPTEGIAPEGDPEAAGCDTEPEGEWETLAKIRREAKNLRDRAKAAEARVDELSREVFALKVASLDKLADASDLPYSPELLDGDKLAEAVDTILAAKPHMAKPRKPFGNVGQGTRGNDAGPKDFGSLLR